MLQSKILQSLKITRQNPQLPSRFPDPEILGGGNPKMCGDCDGDVSYLVGDVDCGGVEFECGLESVDVTALSELCQ